MSMTEIPRNWNSACQDVTEVTNLLFARTSEVLALGDLQQNVYKLVRGCTAATLCHGTVSQAYRKDLQRGLMMEFTDQDGAEQLDPRQVEEKTGVLIQKLSPVLSELVDECRTPLGEVGESRYHGSRSEAFLRVVADTVEHTLVPQPDSCPGWNYVSQIAGRVENVTFEILNENITELHLLCHNELKTAGWKNPVEARSLKEKKIAQRRAYRIENGWTEDEYPDEREHPYLK